MQRTYQLYSTASQANAASTTILARGRITSVAWILTLNSQADDANVAAELSFQQTSQLATNGAQGVVSSAAIYQNILTSGMNQAAVNVHAVGLNIGVNVGDILYLNTSATAGSYKCIIYVEE